MNYLRMHVNMNGSWMVCECIYEWFMSVCVGLDGLWMVIECVHERFMNVYVYERFINNLWIYTDYSAFLISLTCLTYFFFLVFVYW